jgi:cytoskeletal protein CcmA (bactofilin family)
MLGRIRALAPDVSPNLDETVELRVVSVERPTPGLGGSLNCKPFLPDFRLKPALETANRLKSSFRHNFRRTSRKEIRFMDTPRTGDFAHIGKSVVIKGELSGSEDLYVDGMVDGTIELEGNNLVIGPNGQVHANVNAKGVTVQGKLEGNIHASERTELRKSAVAIGDIFTQRIAVEDGAFFKGKVDIQREAAKPQPVAKPEPPVERKVSAPPTTSAAAVGNVVGGAPGNPLAPGTTVTKN